MNTKNRKLIFIAAGLGLWYAAAAIKRRTYDLRGKTVLITGGSRGLELLLAREFARRGARIAVCARDPLELSRAHDEFKRSGIPALSIQCDITKKKDVDRM